MTWANSDRVTSEWLELLRSCNEWMTWAKHHLQQQCQTSYHWTTRVWNICIHHSKGSEDLMWFYISTWCWTSPWDPAPAASAPTADAGAYPEYVACPATAAAAAAAAAEYSGSGCTSHGGSCVKGGWEKGAWDEAEGGCGWEDSSSKSWAMRSELFSIKTTCVCKYRCVRMYVGMCACGCVCVSE